MLKKFPVWLLLNLKVVNLHETYYKNEFQAVQPLNLVESDLF